MKLAPASLSPANARPPCSILSLLNLVHLACWLTGFFSSFMGTIGEACVPPTLFRVSDRCPVTVHSCSHLLHRLTSIVISRFVLNLWDYDYSGVTTDMMASGQLSISLHFATPAPSCAEADPDLCANMDPDGPSDSARMDSAQAASSSICRRLVEFMEPLGAPVGGSLGEGLGLGLGGFGEDGNGPHAAFVLDVEEVWEYALKRSAACAPVLETV